MTIPARAPTAEEQRHRPRTGSARPTRKRPGRGRRVVTGRQGSGRSVPPKGTKRNRGDKRTEEPNGQRDSQQSWQSAYAWRWRLIGALVLAIVIAMVLLRAPFFAISTVQLSGEARTSEGTVLAALALEEDQALATFDTGAAEDAIGELPWVEQVQVSRGWPSTLRVQIRERKPAAAIMAGAQTRWVVVSDDGHVLERRLTPPRGVPLIVANRSALAGVEIGDVAENLSGVLAVSLNMPAQLEPWVDSWTLDASGAVTAELVGSAKAIFGSQSDHRTQYVSLASILDGGTPLVCISEIDLTIPDTPVIHRDRACLMASTAL